MMHTTIHDNVAECPHCGFFDTAPFEWGIDVDSSEEVDCSRCGKLMRVSVSVYYTYEATADVSEDDEKRGGA